MGMGCTGNTNGLFGNGKLSLCMQSHSLAPVLEPAYSTNCLILAILTCSDNANLRSLPAVSKSGQDQVHGQETTRKGISQKRYPWPA